MKKKFLCSVLLLSLFSGLASCQSHHSGKIIFDLNGGEFPGQDFSTLSLDGEAGSRVMVDIPDPVKEGYFFVGWREVTNNGELRVINLRYDDQGNGYYVYPYGSDTFFAYFEPLSTIHFDLTQGAERNGSFVSPKENSNDFDETNGVLNGYVSKSISSLDYLPTATADNMTFQYWYTDYPLVSKTTLQDGKSITHYVENLESEKGVYPFDQQFGTNLMEFPEAVEGDFTLYAYWNEDPLVTVHYNLPGIESTSFYFKSGMASMLKDKIKDVLGMDLNEQASSYYYPVDTKEHRFAGVYLDESLKDIPFYFNSTDPIANVDCYLKWDDLVKVRFDYDGGVFEGETSHEEDHLFYMNDTLSDVDSFVMPTPQKENAQFLYFTVNGERFDSTTQIQSSLLDENGVLNLKAVYESDLKLTIHYDFPTGYDASAYEDVVSYFAKSSDIQTLLVNTKNGIGDPSLCVKGYYTLDEEGKHHDFDGATMPEEDLDVYLEIDYLPMLTLHTLLWDGSSLSEPTDPSLADQVFYLSSAMESTGLEEAYTDPEGKVYLFDGFYQEATCENEFCFPAFDEPSHTEQKKLDVYRRYTKSVTMTLHFNGTTAELRILPGHTLAEYEEEIKALVQADSFLVYADEEHTQQIFSVLPSEDSDLYLVL